MLSLSDPGRQFQQCTISVNSQIVISALLAIIIVGLPMQADPPVSTPPGFILPGGLFCLRVTDIKEVPGDPENDRFEFEFEILNWTGTPASGMQFALNQATGFQGIVDESPFFAGSSVDGGGRPLGPGSDDANFPPFDGTPGTKTGATNNWTVTPVTVNDPQRKQWDAGTPVPGRDLLGVPGPSNIEKTQQACDMIPGCQFNGGTPVLPNIETVDNGAPSIDSQSDNVLDGFVIDIDDFDECEMIGFNWFLTDGSGNPIGTSGQGNQFGFGTFNLFRPSQGNPAITAALDSGGTAALGRCPHGPAAGSLNDGSGSNIGTRTNPARD